MSKSFGIDGSHSIRILLKALAVVLVSLLTIAVSSCGFGHWSAKLWEGGYNRPGGDGVYEAWRIKVNNDGSCAAINSGSGNYNYTDEYTGTWTPISDDVIKLELETQPMTETVTRSNADRDKIMSGARTRYEKREAYKKAYSSTSRISTHVKTLYLRKDGAVAFFEDGLDTPVFRCK